MFHMVPGTGGASLHSFNDRQEIVVSGHWFNEKSKTIFRPISVLNCNNRWHLNSNFPSILRQNYDFFMKIVVEKIIHRFQIVTVFISFQRQQMKSFILERALLSRHRLACLSHLCGGWDVRLGLSCLVE